MLRDDHDLPALPTVVLERPRAGARRRASDVAGLRERTGVAADVPLLVYVGGCAPARGVSTGGRGARRSCRGSTWRSSPRPTTTTRPRSWPSADRRGASGRVHRVDYVDPRHVTRLLRDATAGAVPLLHRPNHEISLVTKYLEYLHAGLPVVVSDVREMAAFTREHDLGEVHRAGDPADLAAAVRRMLDPRGRAARPGRDQRGGARHGLAARRSRCCSALYDRLVPAGTVRPR